VERISKEKVFLAGSREPTPAERTDWEYYRKEVEELRILLAQDPHEKFLFQGILMGVLAGVYRDLSLFSMISRLVLPAGTDTPEPGENTTSSDPKPVQVDVPDGPPESPSPGTTGELEGERR
jgi:hypothetical protein